MITKELVERIVKHETTEEDIISLKDTFGTNSDGRKAFIAALNEILTDEDLHKLNSAIMENAVTINNKVPNFLCRIPDEKIFADLLAIEAKRAGMEIPFDKDNNIEPLKPKNIPPAILNHYATLQEHFYNNPQIQKNNQTQLGINTLIAQSINFIIYAPLLRESETYKNWSNELKLSSEVVLQDMKGQYIKQLSKADIAKYTNKHTIVNSSSNIKKSTENKVNDIITLYSNNLHITTKNIVSNAIEQYESKVRLDNSNKL